MTESGFRKTIIIGWEQELYVDRAAFMKALGRDRFLALEERTAELERYAALDASWVVWQERNPPLNAVFFEMSVGPRTTVRFLRESTMLFAVTSLDSEPFLALEGPELTLCFVRTLELVLERARDRGLHDLPTSLGRTERELAWEGPIPPPAPVARVSVPRPVEPMEDADFWATIEVARRRREFVVKLTKRKAEAFSKRAFELVAALDTPAHHQAAESVIGGLPGDAWEDTRAWVIAGGQENYDAVLREPALLAALLSAVDPGDISLGESILYPGN